MGLVFFDLDGTLTDPKPGITAAVIHALTELGLYAPPPDALTWMIGPPLVQSFARMGVAEPEVALRHYRDYFGQRGLFENTVYAGVPEALVALREAGHRLFLATAKPHVYAVRITRHFGLDTHLEAQFGPDLDGTHNDKAQLLAAALSRLGLSAEDAVMVGDRRQDIVAGQANGLRTLAVTWGYGDTAELAGADAFCGVPGQLPSAIERLLVAPKA